MKEKNYKLVEIQEFKNEVQEAVPYALEFIKRVTNGGDITGPPEVLVTILHDFMMVTAAHIAKSQSEVKNNSKILQVGNLFGIGISHSEDEMAEKEGNYVPIMVPGEDLHRLVNSPICDIDGTIRQRDADKGELTILPIETSPELIDEDLATVCDATTKRLRDTRNLNLVSNSSAILLSVQAMMLGLMSVPNKYRADIEKQESAVGFKFANLFTIGISNKDGYVVPTLAPCSALKLQMKNDALTEEL